MSHTWKGLISRDRVVSGDPRSPWSPSPRIFPSSFPDDLPPDGPLSLHAFKWRCFTFFFPNIVFLFVGYRRRRSLPGPDSAPHLFPNVSPCVSRVHWLGEQWRGMHFCLVAFFSLSNLLSNSLSSNNSVIKAEYDSTCKDFNVRYWQFVDCQQTNVFDYY